jgi:hypothetical protein
MNVNPIVNTKLIADPFRYLPNGQTETIIIPEYSAIVLEEKRERVIQVLPNDYILPEKLPFFLQHYDVFHYTKELFTYLFGVAPDVRIYEYHLSYKVSLFLLFNHLFIERAGEKKDIEIKIEAHKLPYKIQWFKNALSDEHRLGIKVDNVKIENDGLYLTFPKGYYPVVGGLNSLDFGWRTPNFNLVFGTEYDKFFDQDINYNSHKNNKYKDDYIDNINPLNYNGVISDNIDPYFINKGLNGLSLYSIDKYNFKNDERLIPFYIQGIDKFYENSIKKAANTFIITMFDFLLAINRSKYLPINKYEFSATMPHFYGIDRIQSSVKQWDKAKKMSLRALYEQSHRFADSIGTDLSCKHFIDYFIKDSVINFPKLKKDPAKEILKAFKNQPQIPLLLNPKQEIFSRHITNGKSNEDFDDFLNGPKGQMNAKKDIEHILYI